MKITSKHIEYALTSNYFDIRRYLVIPNVSFSFFNWEQDVCVVTDSNYLYEIEIKVSLPDLKKDREKRKWNLHKSAMDGMIRKFYYAMPLELAQKHGMENIHNDKIGLLGISFNKHYPIITTLREAKVNNNAKPITDKERIKLYRLAYLRFWSRENSRMLKQLKGDVNAEPRQEYEKDANNQITA